MTVGTTGDAGLATWPQVSGPKGRSSRDDPLYQLPGWPPARDGE